MEKDIEQQALQRRYRSADLYIGKLPADNKYYAVSTTSGRMVLDPLPLDAFKRALEILNVGY